MPTHLIATNRDGFDLCKANSAQLGVLAEFNFGELTFVTDGPIEKDTYKAFPVGNSPYSGSLEVADETQLLGYARFFRRMVELTKESGREILCFVHGYRHPVERLQETIRRIQKAYIDDPQCNIGHVVMISWPSTDQTDEYRHDRTRAIQTGKGAFLRFLEEWRKFLLDAFTNIEDREQFAGKFNLVAASMGNKLLESSAEGFHFRDLKLFHEVIHTAPDVGRSQFEKRKPLYELAKLARRVHIYHNRGDLVLDISTYVVNELEPRLGKNGPTVFTPGEDNTYFIDVTIPVGIALLGPNTVIDPGDELEFPTVHTYFVKVKRVVADAKHIFAHENWIPGRLPFFRHREELLPVSFHAK
jgi:hypothetical protein